MSEFDVSVFARVVLGLVFLLSGVEHLRRRRGFAISVVQYAILPRPLEQLFATVVPWLEVGGALVLLTGLATMEAAAIMGLLLISFMTAVGVNLARGRRISCGCFGDNELLGPGVLVRIVLLLGLDFLLLSESQPPRPPVSQLGSAAVGVFVLVAAYLWRERTVIRPALVLLRPGARSGNVGMDKAVPDGGR